MKGKPEEIRQILAQNIKKRREALGLTQEQLGEMTELSVQTINTIEGCRMWISDKSVTRLAKALNVEVFQLFMPYHVDMPGLSAKHSAAFLEIWQKTKLLIGKIDAQIDENFKEVLHHSNLRDEQAPANKKQAAKRRAR